ncbi:unnamed protein product [Spirodela intermedia]|uniref:Uncharacterized protein n=1 Tax=Spirodela intermedia TaxID=51605 RepID=A0A7I8J7I6_SPIIN|nr:unnamed protein product [Spirodela intermedia]CAA6666167.1 unnamed protein product [Spirodela intermedia]
MADESVVSPQRRISMTNNHGEKLVGILHETGSKELVILCHGFRSSKVIFSALWGSGRVGERREKSVMGWGERERERERHLPFFHLQSQIVANPRRFSDLETLLEEKILLNLVSVLSREGISTFRFDFSGNGESEGTFQYGNYRKEAGDLRSVIQHFLGKSGRSLPLLATVKKVINISGRFALDRGMEGRLGKNFMERVKEAGFIDVKDKLGPYRVTIESLMDRLSTDMHQASLSIDKDCRVMTVHGSEDEIVPVEDGMDFAKLIPNHTLQIIEGADHGYSTHQAELGSLVLDFIRSNQVGGANAHGDR